MADHDRYEPRLRVAASRFQGSGYRIPTRDNDPTYERYLNQHGKFLVPGSTTVTGALDKSGVTQWAVDNTAAFAVANVDALANRTEEQGFGFLRWYHKRMTPEKFDDPTVDIRDYSNGVLEDRANLGTSIHDWIADFVNDRFGPDLVRPEQTQMANAFFDWYNSHEVEPVESEVTVVGDGYAGTLDHIWQIDGVLTLLDVKTSRRVVDSHLAQLASLGAADTLMREVSHFRDNGWSTAVEYETKKWGKTYWTEDVVPPFTQYAILQVRPDDFDTYGKRVPAYCEMHTYDSDEMDAAYEIFRGALTARYGQDRLKKVRKSKEGRA